VLGVTRLTDVPPTGTGRRYIIERGLSRTDELRAMVAICERVCDPRVRRLDDRHEQQPRTCSA
jgi:hypothetical protein